MKFGPVAVVDAAGLTLAHSTGGFKKGCKLSAEDTALLAARGVLQVMAVQLEAGDVPEDEAARLISHAVAGAHCDVQAPFTGRANIHAATAGLMLVDEARLGALNSIHEGLTVATLRGFERVGARQMLATVKIIPFALPRHAVQRALALLKDGPLLRLAPFVPQRVGLVLTSTEAQKPSLLEKSRKAMVERISALGGALVAIETCPHEQAAVREAVLQLKARGVSLILLFGAAAIVDRADVIPAGLADAGGEVLHLGMPVDPGNLMMLGQLGDVPVIGVPTCARSPKENGFDWVLQRLSAGLAVSARDIQAMGAGGLLAEISSRPAPREHAQAATGRPRIAAIVLAAGLSSRMMAEGQGNKLLADLHGQPLIARTVERVRQSGVDKVYVVTGHQAEAIGEALQGQDVQLVHNPDFSAGLATSLRVGLAAALDCDAAFVCLGDMPLVSPEDMRRMMAAFNVEAGRGLVVPVQGRKMGNPVLWGRPYFDALMQLEGDRGARGLLEARRDEITEIAASDEGILLDADTPEALAQIRAHGAA